VFSQKIRRKSASLATPAVQTGGHVTLLSFFWLFRHVTHDAGNAVVDTGASVAVVVVVVVVLCVVDVDVVVVVVVVVGGIVVVVVVNVVVVDVAVAGSLTHTSQ